jgi:hypothetical protein
MRRARKKPEVVQEPLLFDLGTDRVTEVTNKRGPIVSALMKSIRLAREEDAAYWMLALLRGGQDRAYLGRRCFGSSCEDNLSLQAIEMGSELAAKPPKAEMPYLYSVIASSRGLKWWAPLAKAYTLARCETYEATARPFERETVERLEALCLEALQRKSFVDFFRAYRELKKERQKNLRTVGRVVEIGKASDIPEAQRLAAAMEGNLWQIATRESNAIWQLVWVLCEGPFPGSAEPLDLTGAEQTIARAEARWAAQNLEPVPGWALDGIHTIGSDARFAGTWIGLRNCVEMYQCYGRLDPADPGILVREGERQRRSKGRWPILVQSFTNPAVTYSIEPMGDELTCTCPAFPWRFKRGTNECKHIKKVLDDQPDLLEGV